MAEQPTPQEPLVTREASSGIRGLQIARFMSRGRSRCRALLEKSIAGQTLWPYVTALSPLIVTTVLAPAWMSWIMGMLSVAALYQVASHLEAQIWKTDGRRAFLVYVVPLQGLTIAWVLALAAAGQAAQIPTTVFPYVALLCLVIAPACRWTRARDSRRIALRWSYSALCVLALLVHGLAAFKSLGVL